MDSTWWKWMLQVGFHGQSAAEEAGCKWPILLWWFTTRT